jgi:hypothetical protein
MPQRDIGCRAPFLNNAALLSLQRRLLQRLQ